MNYAGLPDETLAALVGRADKAALSVLYDRYIRIVYSLSLKMLGERTVAEEATQDVFLSLWKRAATYTSEKGKFSSWLLSIAHNRAIDELRRRKRLNAATTLSEQNASEEPDSADVGDQVVDRDRARTILSALGKLPDAQREVITLAYFSGFTQAEIAQRLDTPLGTIKTRMRLGLHKLKALLATPDGEVEPS